MECLGHWSDLVGHLEARSNQFGGESGVLSTTLQHSRGFRSLLRLRHDSPKEESARL